ncbi:MAG TPA: sugar phosphate nucleotidyltransferase, partial [Candidatus Dormibacteraeota bacterium]
EPLLRQTGRFMLTYGDGLSDVDVPALLAFHERSGCAVTVTGVRPVTRYGELLIEGDHVRRFAEKPVSEGWVSGGYFVMTPRVFDYLAADETFLEREPLERLAADGELSVYRHDGFWACMDTYRDMQNLNEQWTSGRAPWKQWADGEGTASRPFRPKLAS